MNNANYQWDLFISYASEDKDDVVRPLVDELKGRNLDVWYDEHLLKVGDRLRESIDQGVAKSQFGVVILSEIFFRKTWPKEELEGLLALEQGGRLLILPVWHKVSKKRVSNYSPMLANRKAVTTDQGIKHVASFLIDAMKLPKDDLPVSIQKSETIKEPIPVILAGCGWWARHRTVLPLLEANPQLFNIVGITELKGESDEYNKLLKPAFEDKNITMPPYYPNLGISEIASFLQY